MIIRYIACLLLFLLCACSDDSDSSKDSKCYAMDERQCGGNPWLEDNNSSSPEQKRLALADFLMERDIEVRSVSLNPSFYEAVCEACFVCPEGSRYFVEIDSSDAPILLSIDFFNLEETLCQ